MTEGFFLMNCRHAKVILAAIVAALPGEGSKLKTLTIEGDEKKHAAALAGVRAAGVTVNMEDFGNGDSDILCDMFSDISDSYNTNDYDSD